MSTDLSALLSLPLPVSARVSALPAGMAGAGRESAFSAALSAELSAQTPDMPASQDGAAVLPAPAEHLAAQAPASSLEPKEAAKIKQAAQDFESLLVYQLLKQMWATIPETGLLNSGLSTQFFREMWLEELANKVSHSGNGIGVAQIVERELLETASRTVKPEDLPQAPQAQASQI